MLFRSKEKEIVLRVCALGFDTRSYTTLQVFFRGKCSDRAVLVTDHAEADVSIIDMDTMHSAKVFASQSEQYPQRPLILLSLNEPRTTLPRAVYVKKPVQVQSMLDALDEVKERLKNPTAATTASVSPTVSSNTKTEKEPQKSSWFSRSSSPPSSPPLEPAPPPPITKEPQEKKAEESEESTKKSTSAKPSSTRTEALGGATQAADLLDERGFGDYIGSLYDIDPSNPMEVKAAQYDPKRYLQGYLQSACKTALSRNCALRLNTGWKPITIFPQTREVWIDADDKQLRSFCLVPVHSISDQDFADGGSAIMTISPASAIRMKEGEYDSNKLQRMDALLWKVALWTSAGRFPEDIDLHRAVYLKHWPNFTRILVFPNALRIAALTTEQPRSLLDIARTLNIRQQYVFAFFSAARALGLADQSMRQSENLIAPAPIEPRKNAGLLKKILQRLRR